MYSKFLASQIGGLNYKNKSIRWKRIGLKYVFSMGQSDVELNNNNQTMGTTQNSNTDNNQVEFIYKVKRKKPRFKPGSELSDKVNKANINVDIDESNQQGEKEINISLDIVSEGEVISQLKDKRKLRFKAGADLTEKVNVFFQGTEVEALTEKKKIRFKAGADLTDKVNKVSIEIDESALEEDLIKIIINVGE
jgi:nucleoid DNA-binding protein